MLERLASNDEAQHHERMLAVNAAIYEDLNLVI